ncbi:PAS domain S-box-containing protein/diguanylate cyclase (GGDEF) domain-containing protein [Marinospirillum celere]|uniref:PAS domain S-box-containing protein/diguanylate cyclase (GGDEF) domain-containing protein n=1 Tax=Marinospirillum celere TaxID=1122252 RepID=A0A1I1JHW9_9GAMM|nr:sensor domain-containing diguanylate cyclase [Marinospirillum celere]SFC48134.1 PAS domain S-box-containing protein/diguanylate cyclase (GGDEF) domain-containing protein [Marinospirillum celere]
MQEADFFQDLVDKGNMLIWVAGLDKGCFYFNQAWLKFTGRRQEQEYGDGWTEGVHPDDLAACLETFNSCFDARQKFSILYRLRRNDGAYRWVQDDACPWYDPDGSFKGFIGYCLDITQQKRTELHEQNRRQLLQAFMANEPLDKLLQQLTHNLEKLHEHIKCTVTLLGNEEASHSEASASLRGFYQQYHQQGGHCWSEPILSSQNQPLGVLSVYCKASKQPSEKDLELIKDEARFAGLMIEKQRAERTLLLGSRVFQQAREAIMITDVAGRIVEVNQGFTEITGFTRDEVLGKNPSLLKSGVHKRAFYRDLWEALRNNECWQGEIWNRRKSGEVYPCICNISLVKDDQGEPRNYVSLFSDITVIKEHQKQLEIMAHYDALTQLPNRVLLADRLQQARVQCLRRQQTLAVAFLDLDGFKNINDTYSHAIGDQLLITLTQRMSKALRESDTLARLGGDEFILILNDLNQPGDYIAVIERLLKAAAEPIIIEDKLLQISASIGVTLFPEDQSDVDGLIRHADHAMYQAKKAGRNCYQLFSPLEIQKT